MTPDDFKARALAAASPKAGEPQFGPLVVLLLPIVIGTVVGWVITRILDALWEHMVEGRSAAARGILRIAYVRPAIRRAMREQGVALGAAEWGDLEDRAIVGITAAARSLTEGERRELEAAAETAR